MCICACVRVCMCACVCVTNQIFLNPPNQIALFILHIQMRLSTCIYSLSPLCQENPHPLYHGHISGQIQTTIQCACCPPKSFSAVRIQFCWTPLSTWWSELCLESLQRLDSSLSVSLQRNRLLSSPPLN